jgi:hypothetical protein
VTKKRSIVAVGMLASFCIAGGFIYPILSPFRRPAPTVENFMSLRKGMQKEEVVAVLGPPSSEGGNMHLYLVWYLEDDCNITIRFSTMWFPDQPPPQTIAAGGTMSTTDGRTLELKEREKRFLDTFRTWVRWN